MSYPTYLSTLYKCLFYNYLPVATDNDQQSYQRLTQTCQRMRFGRWWTFCTYHRCVKNRLKILNRLWKNEKVKTQDPSGVGDFFLTLYMWYRCVWQPVLSEYNDDDDDDDEVNKKAQLTLSNPRDVKACQNCSNSTCFVSFHRILFPQIANA